MSHDATRTLAHAPPSSQPRLAASPVEGVRRAGTTPGAVLITSDELFAGAVEVQIEHRGGLYRLKQTSLGKLILTK